MAYANFKVIVKVDNVNSFSGVHKVKVKLDNGDSKTVKKDLGKLADKADWDLIKLAFNFKHSPKTFKACLDNDCIKGHNSPKHKPEIVKFELS